MASKERGLDPPARSGGVTAGGAGTVHHPAHLQVLLLCFECIRGTAQCGVRCSLSMSDQSSTTALCDAKCRLLTGVWNLPTGKPMSQPTVYQTWRWMAMAGMGYKTVW